MCSKADETFVIVETLICHLQISHLTQNVKRFKVEKNWQPKGLCFTSKCNMPTILLHSQTKQFDLAHCTLQPLKSKRTKSSKSRRHRATALFKNSHFTWAMA